MGSRYSVIETTICSGNSGVPDESLVHTFETWEEAQKVAERLTEILGVGNLDDAFSKPDGYTYFVASEEKQPVVDESGLVEIRVGGEAIEARRFRGRKEAVAAARKLAGILGIVSDVPLEQPSSGEPYPACSDGFCDDGYMCPAHEGWLASPYSGPDTPTKESPDCGECVECSIGQPCERRIN